MKTKEKKYIAAVIGLVIWVGFWTYMDRSTPSNPTNLVSQTVEPTVDPRQVQFEKCQKIRAEGESIDKASSELVKQARVVQMIWIKNEMSKLHESRKISAAEWEVFSKYVAVGDGTPRLPLGEIDTLMKRVVSAGYIKPYLPKEVVDIGTKAALSPSSSDYFMDFPECFSDTEFEQIKMIANLVPLKGVWAKKIESPVDLIPLS